MAYNYTPTEPRDGTWVDPSAGRFGDTFVRNVGGVPSHVNPIEADWIDRLGPLGESLTMAAGSGTTNPKDGAPEYSFQALLPLIPIGYDMYKNWKTRNDEPALADNMANWKGEIDQLNTRADDLMDPGSAYNQSMINNLKKNNFDQLAFTNQMGNRNAAQGGVGGYSGIQNQTAQANMDRMQQINQQATDKLLQTNLDRGINLQGNVANQMAAYDQPFAQQEINQFAGGGMLDSAMSGGGMKGILGAMMALAGAGDAGGGGGGEGFDAYGDPVSFEGSGGGGGGLGSIFESLGSMFFPNSDIRLKKNINLIGKSPSGINVYEFNYKDLKETKHYGKSRYQGVMANEVPWVSMKDSKTGYLKVDYSKIDVEFKKVYKKGELN